MTDVSFIYNSFNGPVNSSRYTLSNFRMNFAYKSDFRSMVGGMSARQPGLLLSPPC
jgi:hypothetical protein